MVANTAQERRRALEKLLPHHRNDLAELFVIMSGLPVTIRLLDYLPYEFLPRTEADMAEVAEAAGKAVEEVKTKVVQLREKKPLLGLRGCHLAIVYPEIYEMQCRAIFEAVVVITMNGSKVLLEIMLPFILAKTEFVALKKMVDSVAYDVMKASGVTFEYIVGAAIELPRAALTAEEIAEHAQFFSFCTNHLTQMTYGLSGLDAVMLYQDLGLLPNDPFTTIDQKSVGLLVRLACEKGRNTRSDIRLGLCDKHGGDPASIYFCHNLGLNHVSCSPYRIPIARLAAAQAELMTHGSAFVESRQ